MLRRLVERDGWRVIEAADGQEALDCVARQAPRLILLDLMMPRMDGFEVVAALRRRADWRAIPVVVITAKDVTEEDRRRLHGSVETIVQKDALGQQALLDDVRDRLRAGALRGKRGEVPAAGGERAMDDGRSLR
jgi:CheY-like chemotaxis protein